MSTNQNYKHGIGIEEIGAMTRRLKHNGYIKIGWDKEDCYLIYDQVVKILPDMTFSEFDYGMQWRTIFHEDFPTACNEIAHIMAGVI